MNQLVKAEALVVGDIIQVGKVTAEVTEIYRTPGKTAVGLFTHDANGTLAERLWNNDKMVLVTGNKFAS